MIYFIQKDFLKSLDYSYLLKWMKPNDKNLRIEDSLIKYALDNKSSFVESSTVRDIQGQTYRKSKVLFIQPSQPLFKWWNSSIIPFIEGRFLENIKHLKKEKIDLQLTYHGESNFYKAHTDCDINNPNTSSRIITFVYYFFIEPKLFQGGMLKLYKEDNTSVLIEPSSDSLVTFLSSTLHEVTPVSFNDNKVKDDFKLGRFTLNGWIHYI